jgi:hypothetical protein
MKKQIMDIQKQKIELEAKISNLLYDFETKTGCIIRDVNKVSNFSFACYLPVDKDNSINVFFE